MLSCCAGGKMEGLAYETLDTTFEYEERQYRTSWWAKTALTVTGQLIDQASEGLAHLKRYREGFNSKQVVIPEKLPVLLRIQCDMEDTEQNSFMLYQYLGEDGSTELPAPTDKNVNVEKWLGFEAFVRPFEQLLEDEDFICEARNLRAFLAEFHAGAYYHDDYYYLANYDGIDNLWKEKNEIWFIKKNY